MIELHNMLLFLITVANKEEIKEKNNHIIQFLIDNHYIQYTHNRYSLTKNCNEYMISDLLELYFKQFQCPKCAMNNKCSMDCYWNGLKETMINYSKIYTLEDLIKGYCFN
jgi:hypothetical protein